MDPASPSASSPARSCYSKISSGSGQVAIRHLVRTALRMRLDRIIVLSGFELPLRVVREQIASALDLIIQQARLEDGSRRVTSVTEVVGMEGDTIVLNEIFKHSPSQQPEDGAERGQAKIVPTGIRPMFEPKLKKAGFNFPPKLFGAEVITLNTSRRR